MADASLPAETAQPLQDLDPHRLSQRQRQIDFGKNTAGYTAYTERVPKCEPIRASALHSYLFRLGCPKQEGSVSSGFAALSADTQSRRSATFAAGLTANTAPSTTPLRQTYKRQ